MSKRENPTTETQKKWYEANLLENPYSLLASYTSLLVAMTYLGHTTMLFVYLLRGTQVEHVAYPEFESTRIYALLIWSEVILTFGMFGVGAWGAARMMKRNGKAGILCGKILLVFIAIMLVVPMFLFPKKLKFVGGPPRIIPSWRDE